MLTLTKQTLTEVTIHAVPSVTNVSNAPNLPIPNDINVTNATTIKTAVKTAVANYFLNLDGEAAYNIYALVLAQVEQPLLEIVMQQANGNQSKAAEWLGLSRNTLRKLLAKYAVS